MNRIKSDFANYFMLIIIMSILSININRVY